MALGTTCTACAESQCELIADCECPTLMLDKIDRLITALWEQDEDRVDVIVQRVLETIYATTPDGRPIDWRKLSIDTATCLLELRRRVRARVVYVLAHYDEDAAQRRWEHVGGGR
jgi:hypothetical protein